MTRKVYLNHLPHGGIKIPDSRINWEESIGCKIPFIYDDIQGEIEILDYNKVNRHLKLKYENNIETMFRGSFQCMSIQKLIYPDKYENNYIWNTDPWLGELLWDKDDGYKYSSGSNKKLDFKCPDCGERIKKKVIHSVHSRRKVPCNNCSDGISYPNKLMYNLLKQIGINFEVEYSPEWSVISNYPIKKLNGKKKYDFYIPSLKLIIEMHGIQHYEETRRKGARTLEQEQENDRLKKELVEKNGLKYIEIDSRYSNLEFVKQNILRSELKECIDLINVNWENVDEDSQKSFVKIACELFNSDDHTSSTIGVIMGIHSMTVVRYLKIGAKLGWCNYDANEEKIKASMNQGDRNKEYISKPIVRLTTNGEFIDEFKSAAEAINTIDGLHSSNISKACRRTSKPKLVGGFMWMFKEDYLKNKDKIKPYEKKENPRSRAVIQLSLSGEYIGEFKSIGEAAKQLKLYVQNIHKVCNGSYKHTGGFKWTYKSN